MIEVKITGDDKVVASFNARSSKLHARILRTVQSLTIQLQAFVKSRKLSGASPKSKAAGESTGIGKYAGQALGVRTGRLRRSITQRIKETATEVDGIVGTNVAYGRVHEYGFSGVVPVREHMRNSRNGSHTVKAHSRSVQLPERSFLRSSLKENKAHIEQSLRDAVKGAMNE